MKKSLLIIAFSFILFTIVLFQSGFASTDYNAGCTLYKYGYYAEARLPLLFSIYTNPLSSSSLYARFLIGLSYAHEKQYEKARKELYKLKESLTVKNAVSQNYQGLFCEMLYQIAYINFYTHSFDQFLMEKKESDASCQYQAKTIRSSFELLEIAALTYTMQWEDSYRAVAASSALSASLKHDLLTDISQPISHHDKSPYIGGILALIPGLGHIYAGRLTDGVRSFIINGSFATLTIYSILQKGYIFAGLFGTIETVLYSANIYGGVNAVLQENARYYVETRDAILKKIPIPPLRILTIRKEIGLE